MSLSTTALDSAAVAPDSDMGRAVAARAPVFAMTQNAEDAVLRPDDPGAFPHSLRHALAARIAAQNGLADLSAHYRGGAGDHAALADPAGAVPGDQAQIVAFMDAVSVAPRDVTADDVAGLQQAGIADGDIVRLAELNAFMAYHCRLISGLRLMTEPETGDQA